MGAPRHVETLVTRHNLARNLVRVGREEEAEQMWRTVMDDFHESRQTGDFRYDVVTTGFGKFLAERKRFDEARPLLESAAKNLHARFPDPDNEYRKRVDDAIKLLPALTSEPTP
jgi:Tfp pilus assembly protein PilF